MNRAFAAMVVIGTLCATWPTAARAAEAPWLTNADWLDQAIAHATHDRSAQVAGVRLVFSYGAYPYYGSSYYGYGLGYPSYYGYQSSYGYPSYYGPWVRQSAYYAPYPASAYYHGFVPVQRPTMCLDDYYYAQPAYFAAPAYYVVRGHHRYRGCYYW